MSGIYIQDGRRTGHHTWAIASISAGNADGVFISPFCTPRYSIPRYTGGESFVNGVTASGGQPVFDAMTHARLLPRSDKLDLYDTWELWGSAGVGLDSPAKRQQHLERVFARQTELGLVRLAPTQTVQSPTGAEADDALATSRLAASMASECWQSLSAGRSFWRAGSDLDAYVGLLVELRSPVWVLTLANDLVVSAEPDLSDIDALEGFLRTVRSLAERSRVVVAFADYAGLPAVAAGADTIGTGWDRGMRTFDPASFHVDSDPGIRIPASYVTQAGLHAVLRRDAANAIERWDPSEAARIRGGGLPGNDAAEREHHLRSLRDALLQIHGESTPADRVARLRGRYATALADFETLVRTVGPSVRANDRVVWHDGQSAALEAYAVAEGF